MCLEQHKKCHNTKARTCSHPPLPHQYRTDVYVTVEKKTTPGWLPPGNHFSSKWQLHACGHAPDRLHIASRMEVASEFLKQELLLRAERIRGYSLRALARDLGVSHTYLSLIISGKKRISTKRALEFGELLRLSDSQKEALFKSSLPASGPKRAASRNKLPLPYRLQIDSFRFMSDWYHLAILDLVETADFKSDFSWIARRLRISRAEAKSAVLRLSRLGLLDTTSAPQWKTSQAMVVVEPTISERCIRKFHEQMIHKALEALSSPKDEDYRCRNITGITMPVDPERIEEAKRKITRFRRSLLRFLAGGHSTEVYQLNVQLFPLTKRKKRKRYEEPLI